jgi:hypothetical protein
VKRRTLALGLVVALGALVPLAAGQERKSQLRTVRGTVVNKDEAPLPGAVVYLKNLKSLTVRTYIADEEGNYRFSGLDPNVDHEIHAEHQGYTSAKRTISSLDTRREIVIPLKVDKKKS